MSLAALRWLLPAQLYDMAGFGEHAQSARHRARPTRQAGRWPVIDGPASRQLDALMRPLLPLGSTRTRGVDYGDVPRVAATDLYRGPNGGYIRVLRRLLGRPLLLDAFAHPTHEGCVHALRTGTELLHCDDDAADAHRLVMVRPNGTLLIVESTGVPSTNTSAPLSSARLDELARALDDPRLDLHSDVEVDDQAVTAVVH